MEVILIPLITGGVMLVFKAARGLSSTSTAVEKTSESKRHLWFTKDAKFEKEQARKQMITSENYRKLQKAEYDHHKSAQDARKAVQAELDLFDKHILETEEPFIERKVMALCGAFDAYLDMEFPSDPQEFLAVLESADKEYAKVRNTIEADYTGLIRKNATNYVIDVWNYFGTDYMKSPAYSAIHDLAARRYAEVHPLWLTPHNADIEQETFTQMNARGEVVAKYTTDMARSEETFKIDLSSGKVAYGINKNIVDFEWSDLFKPLSKKERDKLFTPTAAEVLNLLEDYHKAHAQNSLDGCYRALNRFFNVDTCKGLSIDKIMNFVAERNELFNQQPDAVEIMRAEMDKRLERAEDKKFLVRLWEGDVTAEDFYDKRSVYGTRINMPQPASDADLINAGGWAYANYNSYGHYS